MFLYKVLRLNGGRITLRTDKMQIRVTPVSQRGFRQEKQVRSEKNVVLFNKYVMCEVAVTFCSVLNIVFL